LKTHTLLAIVAAVLALALLFYAWPTAENGQVSLAKPESNQLPPAQPKPLLNESQRAWQQDNSKALLSGKWKHKVFPHRVNAIKKLNKLWGEGFRSFEMDVHIKSDQYGGVIFQVGHHEGAMGVELVQHFSDITPQQIERLWLDIKNLNRKNCEQALDYLDLLDRQWAIRNKVIFESPDMTDCLRLASEAGWHTTYYMPTRKVLGLMEKGSADMIKGFVASLSKQLATQQARAVSFDSRLYPFIKQHVEERLDPELVYHVWRGPVLHDASFLQNLESLEYLQDPRVKTLLVTYKSEFDL
jgi:hypothetical protein